MHPRPFRSSHLPAPDRALEPRLCDEPNCDRDPSSGMDPGTYFLVLECVRRICAQDGSARLADTDAVADIALQRVQVGRSSVVSPDRYDAWVAVVCRNTYLNFIRARRSHRPLDDADAVLDPRQSLEGRCDAPVVREALLRAIDRLPRFLQEVARLRFAEDWSHSSIARQTGKEIPIVRAYANKAATRLRTDVRLTGLLREWRG